MSIFVSIASYRDPELVPTLRDLLLHAHDPDALRICVCDQFGPETAELPDDLAADPRIVRLAIPWEQSQGACWARAQVMSAYQGETWYLQLDSHHRFVPGWDRLLLEQWTLAAHPKAVLSTYVHAYVPGEPVDPAAPPQELHFDAFHEDGIAVFIGAAMAPDDVAAGRPTRGRFLSGHFLFAPGSFVAEVPYDPALYFIGEEISLSVRAHLAGYAFFHPAVSIVFHEYTRNYRDHKHWLDHQAQAVEIPWWQRDAASRGAVVALLQDETLTGIAGGLAGYEDFAGLCFRTRRVHPATWMRLQPPAPVTPGWQTRGARYAFHVPFPRDWWLPEHPDPCWTLHVYDDEDRLLVRRTWWRAEFHKIPTDATAAWFPVALDSETPPTHYTIGDWYDDAVVRVAGEVLLPPARPHVTWVTALVDLGREALAESRPFADYRRWLEALLRDGLPDDDVVVYCDPADFDWVRAARGAGAVSVRALTRQDVRDLAQDAQIEALRVDLAWRAQAPWLADSPQAALPGYVGLVFHKFSLLAQVASEVDPQTTVMWVDAGISRTVAVGALAGLSEQVPTDSLRFFAFPYPVDTPEVHGFARAPLHALAGGEVTEVLRGGVFGGRAALVPGAHAAFEALKQQTLAQGRLGTEESLFSILARRGAPGFTGLVPIGEDGLLVSAHFGRLPQRVVLPPRPDRIALAAWARQWHALDRRGAPGHAWIEGPNAWAHAALVAPWLLRGDVLTVVDTGEGEAARLAFVPAEDRRRAFLSLAPVSHTGPGRCYVQTAEGRVPPAANAGTRVAVYVLTFQAPHQLDVWAAAAEAAAPSLLHAERRVLVDNSLDADAAAANARWCKKWGFVHLRFANVGITGGRMAAIADFVDHEDVDQMWYFEDDMLLTSEGGVCDNGYRRHVPRLFETVTNLVANEEALDLLKLSYTEFWGCHQLNWAWINLSPQGREASGAGSATQVHTIRSSEGLPWALGDVHYSHWPSVLTRRGAALLLDARDEATDEAELMRWVFRAQQEGRLSAGVLLASPIEHQRVANYGDGLRRE